MHPGDESDELIPTRLSLLKRLKDWEDHEGWRVFFDTYWRLIYGVAVKAGLNDAEAQDVVQETVIVVARKIEDFKYDPATDSFKGWLLYLTRKRIATAYRNRARDRGRTRPEQDITKLLELDQVQDPAGVDVEAIWEAEWERGILDAAILRVKGQVAPKQFQMFSYYVLKQTPVTEVAEMLDVTPAQIYLAKHRITALLQKEVDRVRRGWMHSRASGAPAAEAGPGPASKGVAGEPRC